VLTIALFAWLSPAPAWASMSAVDHVWLSVLQAIRMTTIFILLVVFVSEATGRSDVSPWYGSPEGWKGKFDPDKAKSLLKKAKAVGMQIDLMANDSWPYMQQTGALLQAMWTEVGFKVNYNIFDNAVLQQKRKEGSFHAESMAGSYRFDPDGWFSRQVLSTAAQTKVESRFRNEKADQLIVEARKTADKAKRLEMYREVENIINDELPRLYTHHLTLLEAGVMNLKGYQPAISGSPNIKGGGLRTAWMA
jgi:ABC-type transport system substrate-binding protein